MKQTKCLCIYAQKVADSWPLQYDDRVTDESLENIKKFNQPKTIATDTGVFSYEYVEVYFDTISRFYQN